MDLFNDIPKYKYTTLEDSNGWMSSFINRRDIKFSKKRVEKITRK